MGKPDLSFSFRKSVQKDVHIYIGRNSSQKVVDVLDGLSPDKVFIISDSKIAGLYVEALRSTIAKKYPVHVIIHKPEEVNKSLEAITNISNDFFISGGTEKSTVVALGGGVTGNMAGFFASVAFRGIKLVHIPTTLLAQLDSAADVKQSVNSSKIKNSIGSYKAPDAVIIDSIFLKSLNDREIRAGLSEAIKHGLAQDMGLVEYILACDKRDLDALQKITTRTIDLKIEHWERTPTIWNDAHKIERLTHLGHTTGKILEMIDVDYLTHGEAIAHGMVIEARMSYRLGYLGQESVEKVHKILSGLGLLYPLGDKYIPESIIARLYNSADEPIFALLKELGNPQTISTAVSKEIVQEVVNWYFKKYLS